MAITYPIVLRDADEIEKFYFETTGIKTSYLQLSEGLADLRYRVVDLNGVTLAWARMKGHARWIDENVTGVLHIGIPIKSPKPIILNGHKVQAGEAQVWMPNEPTDMIMMGPNMTLEIGVDRQIAKKLGWHPLGRSLNMTVRKDLTRFAKTCGEASDAIRKGQGGDEESTAAVTRQWRERVLTDLGPLLEPWFKGQAIDQNPVTMATGYNIVRKVDAYFASIDFAAHDDYASVSIDDMIDSLGVPRRTVFHAFRSLLGVGPRRYFELRRLQTLRSRLRQATYIDTTVAQIAYQLGFGDMGRLAERYRRQYGENPSETLRYG